MKSTLRIGRNERDIFINNQDYEDEIAFALSKMHHALKLFMAYYFSHAWVAGLFAGYHHQ